MSVYCQILVAVDFSPAASRALKFAAELARRCGGILHVVHVVDTLDAIDSNWVQIEVEMEAREWLRELLCRECPDVDARRVVLRSSSPARAILDYARDAGVELIVTGTHGRSGVKGLVLGSVAQTLVRSAHCPVLMARAPESQAPPSRPRMTPAMA